MGFSGSLKKLEIIAYRDNEFKNEAGTFSVYINPEQYQQTYSLCYNAAQAQGESSASPVYNKTKPDVVSFKLVFDGTGVVPTPLPGVIPFTDDGIAQQIEEFLDLTVRYHGDIHRPYYLKLSWGTLLFKCQLRKVDVTYTLFKPDGTPLRAVADVSFEEYLSPKKRAEEEKKSSPDLSHVLTVKAGDSLPLMCYRIYGSSLFYPQVARVNGLTDFRELTVGRQLLFPPLASASQEPSV